MLFNRPPCSHALLDFGSRLLVKTLRPLSGPSPAGKAVQAKACDILAAFALSRRTIRYGGVEKHAVFGPKWWPTISPRGVWPSGRPDSKESGACVPLEKVASLFVPRRFPKPPRQRVVHDDTSVIQHSAVNTGGTGDSVATDGPHRPVAGSRHLTSPAKERAVTLTA